MTNTTNTNECTTCLWFKTSCIDPERCSVERSHSGNEQLHQLPLFETVIQADDKNSGNSKDAMSKS